MLQKGGEAGLGCEGQGGDRCAAIAAAREGRQLCAVHERQQLGLRTAQDPSAHELLIGNWCCAFRTALPSSWEPAAPPARVVPHARCMSPQPVTAPDKLSGPVTAHHALPSAGALTHRPRPSHAALCKACCVQRSDGQWLQPAASRTHQAAAAARHIGAPSATACVSVHSCCRNPASAHAAELPLVTLQAECNTHGNLLIAAPVAKATSVRPERSPGPSCPGSSDQPHPNPPRQACVWQRRHA